MLIMQLRTAIVSLCVFFLLGISAQAAPIATVAGLYGNPTANGRALSAGSQIQEHDKIVVETGNVQLLFTDGTKLVVGEHSTLVVEKYLMKGGNKVSNFTVDALRGTFRFITGDSAKSAYNIQTANATIGIRGTGFDFWADNSTGVVVLEGKVRLCRKNAGCVNINPNCDAGIAEPGKARKMTDSDFISKVARRLPYLQGQAFLKTAFRLKISSCQSRLNQYSGNGNAGGPQPSPAQPSPASPPPGDDGVFE